MNIIGTISRKEIAFNYSPNECKMENARYFINKNAIKDGVLFGYVYASGIRNNGTDKKPAKFKAIECFDMFNNWRLSINDADFFTRNEFLELID